MVGREDSKCDRKITSQLRDLLSIRQFWEIIRND